MIQSKLWNDVFDPANYKYDIFLPNGITTCLTSKTKLTSNPLP